MNILLNDDLNKCNASLISCSSIARLLTNILGTLKQDSGDIRLTGTDPILFT
jgi:hypothetical protein